MTFLAFRRRLMMLAMGGLMCVDAMMLGEQGAKGETVLALISVSIAFGALLIREADA